MWYIITIYVKFLKSILLIKSWSTNVISEKFSVYSLPREGAGSCRILIISQATCFCIIFPPLEKKCKIESIMHVLCLPEKQVELTTFGNIIFYFARWTLAAQNSDNLILLYSLRRSHGYLSERDSNTKSTILIIERQKSITGPKERMKPLISIGI